jgi:transposase-like protein
MFFVLLAYSGFSKLKTNYCRLPQKLDTIWGIFMERKKYDYAFKLECVKLVLEKCYSCNYVSVEKE